MSQDNRYIVVAGHICLDVIPSLQIKEGGFQQAFMPGKLVETGAALLSTGGAVSNTGIALHKLGLPTRLMGKLGDDLFGKAVMDLLNGHHTQLSESMIVSPGEATSYSIVIDPGNVDRIFLHCTGANDTFDSKDLKAENLEQAMLFHFGYPPLMKQMYADDGAELATILKLAKQSGTTVSLDMARPDPDSPAGKVNWRQILANVLPYVDLFLPSFEEILYMLNRERYNELSQRADSSDLIGYADTELLSSLTDEMIQMGTAVAGIKLGERGLFVKTTSDEKRWNGITGVRPDVQQLNWLNRELYVPCYQVTAEGTTGAGDCTIAGFLAGWVLGLDPEEALLGAVGVGACNVEKRDAVSGIPSWQEVQQRISGGWAQHPVRLTLKGFQPNHQGVWSATKSES